MKLDLQYKVSVQKVQLKRVKKMRIKKQIQNQIQKLTKYILIGNVLVIM